MNLLDRIFEKLGRHIQNPSHEGFNEAVSIAEHHIAGLIRQVAREFHLDASSLEYTLIRRAWDRWKKP